MHSENLLRSDMNTFNDTVASLMQINVSIQLTVEILIFILLYSFTGARKTNTRCFMAITTRFFYQ